MVDINTSFTDNRWMPFDFEKEMNITSRYNPKAKMRGNNSFRFWKRALLQRAMSTIDATLPENWKGPIRDNFFEYLFVAGYCAVYDDPEFGKAWQPCNLSGYGFFYQPTKAIITNPLFEGESKILEIGKECGILKLTPDYCGVLDIVNYYAEQMASNHRSILTGLMNAWGSKIALAKNKAAAETIKKIYDKMSSGEPLVIAKDIKPVEDDTRSGTPSWNMLELQCKKDEYIIPEILTTAQTILNGFDAEIGIPTLPYQKKERMVSDEATMRTYDGQARSLTWINTLSDCADEINRIIPGIDLKFALHYSQDEENASGSNTEEVNEK